MCLAYDIKVDPQPDNSDGVLRIAALPQPEVARRQSNTDVDIFVGESLNESGCSTWISEPVRFLPS